MQRVDVVEIGMANDDLLLLPPNSPAQNRGYFTKKLVFAIKSSIVGSVGGLLFGYDLGVISGALPCITTEFGLDVGEQELVTSLMLAGCVVGAAFGGMLCDYVGRKATVFIVCGIFIIGALMLAFTQSLSLLYVGRFVIGIGVAISAIVDVAYLTEISPLEYRGAVVSTNELMITIGLLLAFIIDHLFLNVSQGWRWMFGFPLVLSVIWMALMAGMPESPRWLLTHHRASQAHAVFLLTTNTCEEARVELEKATLACEEANKMLHGKSFWDICKEWRYSIIVSVILMLLQNFSGNISVLSYAPEFFGFAGLTSNAASVATILLGIVKVVATAVSLLCVDRFGRKILLKIGITGMTVCLVVMALIFAGVTNEKDYSSEDKPLSKASTGLLLGAVCVFIACYAIGYGPVTWLVASEMFADEIRGRTLGVATVANWVGNVIVVSSFLSAVQEIGMSQTFSIYAILCAVAFTFVWFFVPETRLKEPVQVARDLADNFARAGAFLGCNTRTDEDHMLLAPHSVSDSHQALMYHDNFPITMNANRVVDTTT